MSFPLKRESRENNNEIPALAGMTMDDNYLLIKK